VSALDARLLADKAAAVERHLARVAARLPASPQGLEPGTDASDVVVLHLWQAVQLVVDLALSLCLDLRLGTPSGYGDAFRRLSGAGVLERDLASRLARAAEFRNMVAHASEPLDMARIHRAATQEPADLRAFLAAVRDRLREP
jgi:uncharacterized protein YutE (UPF0331/DUF86 family)